MLTSNQPDAGKLSAVFMALAHPTRRAVIDRLGRAPASVSELARPFDMGLPAFLKHLRTLEECGLISTRKLGRTRTCTIAHSALSEAEQWLANQRAVWEGRADRLEAFVSQEHATEVSGDADNQD